MEFGGSVVLPTERPLLEQLRQAVRDDTRSTSGAAYGSAIEPVRVGDVLSGNYKLLQLIGRRGMSYVYEAEDRLLSRRVALKVLAHSQQGVDLLLDEARALSAVRHSGLPTVHGVGLHRGCSYLVMERIYGLSLEQHLDQAQRRPLSLDEGLAILAPITETLAAVHAAGFAHRDLAPANIMISPGRVVLLDLGITPPEVTAKDFVRYGTPDYLAPELIDEKVRPGSAHLVDTYAFGAMAFEMFAGRPPFEAETPELLFEQHRTATPPHLVVLRPDLPRALSELVDACLAKDPLDRPRDMQAITWELRNLRRRAVDGSGPVRIPGHAASTRETYRRALTDPAIETASGTSWDVLVVDDDEDGRTGLAAVLKAQGFRPRVAVDGREAIDLIHRTGWRPCVIVLDLVMPVMDGFQFLAIQAEDAALNEIPVIVVTGTRAEDARRFSAVRGVISKPFVMSSLLVLLRDVCRSSRTTGRRERPQVL